MRSTDARSFSSARLSSVLSGMLVVTILVAAGRPTIGAKPPAPKKAAGNVAAGKAVYDAQHCMACHKIADKGGVSGPDLSASIGSASAATRVAGGGLSAPEPTTGDSTRTGVPDPADWWGPSGAHAPEHLATSLEATRYFEPPTVTYANAVHAALVEVDVETGMVRLLKYVVVHDCGRAINPLVIDGQICGGVAQGIGDALMEEIVYDENGQLLNASLLDYLVPTAGEIPPFGLGHHESPSPRNPLGVKGLGEGGAISPPAAIANAVEDALRPLGVEVREMPLSPQRVLGLIEAAGAAGRT